MNLSYLWRRSFVIMVVGVSSLLQQRQLIGTPCHSQGLFMVIVVKFKSLYGATNRLQLRASRFFSMESLYSDLHLLCIMQLC